MVFLSSLARSLKVFVASLECGGGGAAPEHFAPLALFFFFSSQRNHLGAERSAQALLEALSTTAAAAAAAAEGRRRRRSRGQQQQRERGETIRVSSLDSVLSLFSSLSPVLSSLVSLPLSQSARSPSLYARQRPGRLSPRLVPRKNQQQQQQQARDVSFWLMKKKARDVPSSTPISSMPPVVFLPIYKLIRSSIHISPQRRSAPNKRPHPFFIAAGLKVHDDGENDR